MISLIIAIAIIGFIVWAVITYIPMPALFKNAIVVIAVVLVLLYVLRALGFQDIPLR